MEKEYKLFTCCVVVEKDAPYTKLEANLQYTGDDKSQYVDQNGKFPVMGIEYCGDSKEIFKKVAINTAAVLVSAENPNINSDDLRMKIEEMISEI